MVRQSIRHLTGTYPLITLLGVLTIFVSGLLSFDTSLAVVQGTRTLHRAAPSGPVYRMVNGHKVKITTVKPRAVKASEKGVDRSFDNVTYEKARCGDKLILLTETCDDGNAKSGDGCSSACKIEAGFICNAGQPSACWSTCGDGMIASGKEDCDDGNGSNGDGCSQYCRVDPGYSCTGEPSTCTLEE